jgi:hypothetical protein
VSTSPTEVVPTELDVDRLLSGESGIVSGKRGRLVGGARDLADDLTLWARLVPARLRRAARAAEGGPVQVLGLYSNDYSHLMRRTVGELARTPREIRFALGALDDASPSLERETTARELRGAGKFQNLNVLLEQVVWDEADWIIVVDDDVELPRGFLDRFLVLAEWQGLQLAQPALRRTSHAAWAVCRRERGTIVRVTRLVEIGPVTAFHRSVAKELLPFPPLRMGWGLDLHWGGLARERGWRLGIVDAVPVRHEARITASGYDRGEAIAELRGFLDGKPHIDRADALMVVERHRGLP